MMDFQGKVKVNLSIWDTGTQSSNFIHQIYPFTNLFVAGQEKFHSLTGSYYRGAHAILLGNYFYLIHNSKRIHIIF